MDAARIIQLKKQVAQLSQRDRATHAPVGYSNLMTGGVGLYCGVLVAVSFTCCQVTHDCVLCRVGDV